MKCSLISCADKKTIKSAYRQLARKFHPDVNKESDAEDRFKDISAAYEVRPPPVVGDPGCSGDFGGVHGSMQHVAEPQELAGE